MEVMRRDIMDGRAGSLVLGMGNDAIARGALEAGVHFAASYPGTPASEILQNLAEVAERWHLHVEWSVNEKVAFEAATAAAWAGLRALASMKQNGLFVLLDTLVNVTYTGQGRGGLVLVVADDPNAHSSTTEADARPLGHYAHIPVLEPSTHQEAKDIMEYAFSLSESHGTPVLVRTTTRLAHTQQSFRLGSIRRRRRRAAFDRNRPLHNLPHPHQRHAELHRRLDEIRQEFEKSPWNLYHGPDNPHLLIVTSGQGWLHANEAIRILRLQGKAAILRVATLNPLPRQLLLHHLTSTKLVLFVEEVEPYLEREIRCLASSLPPGQIPGLQGKLTGHLPQWGELAPDTVIKAVASLLKLQYQPVDTNYAVQAEEAAREAPPRPLTFCPGCPHRAAYYAIRRAIKRNGNKGFVTGDIGCYSLGAFYHDIMRSQHAMGTGVGLASGFGCLQPFGLEEPVIAVIGDSTLYHAGIPALINIRYQQANATICILDNQATAMTGFQPHPGTGRTATGATAPRITPEELLRGLGYTQLAVVDPYQLDAAIQAVYQAITSPGSHAIIFRRPCPLAARRREPTTGRKPPAPTINPAKCRGSECRQCISDFNCPAINWDTNAGHPRIDPHLCTSCGVCAQICPHQAITTTN